MSYFRVEYSVEEAGGNQSIVGQNMWPCPLCDALDPDEFTMLLTSESSLIQYFRRRTEMLALSFHCSGSERTSARYI